MQHTVTASTLELLAWVERDRRSYAETMEAWRTHCPRLTIWEDAIADGLVRVVRREVVLTPLGRETLHG